jgi:CarboxypepD_reg-like domain
MLKNFFSINKNQVAVLTTLAVILILASIYFFVYIPNNEKIIQQQRFRALQNIDRNIHDKIENSVGLLNNLLSNYQKAGAEERKNIGDYIQHYPRTNFIITQPDTILSTNWAAKKDSLDSAYTIHADDYNKQINLEFVKKAVVANRVVSFQIGMQMTFEQFIRFLLPAGIFDEYIIFSNNKTVYESFPAGISDINKDSVFSNHKGIISSGVVSQNIGGTDYRIFLQPVQIASSSEWMVGGLLSNQRYQAERNQLPTAMILMLVTVLLIILVTLPWIKLYLMGSKDRLTVTDGIMAIIISMLLMSLLFFTFFKYNLSFRSGASGDSKEVLAKNIINSFKQEVDDARQKLKSADSLAAVNNFLQEKDIKNLNKNSIAFSSGSEQIDSAVKNKMLSIFNGTGVNQVFWLDNAGDEKRNWTALEENAPHGNYSNREYFKKIISNNQYVSNSNPADQYYLDQVISWTSGIFTSLISVTSALSTDKNKMVAALSFNAKSLDSVVLPAGYLFAVTDNRGKVLYHSEKSKNLTENLLQEFSESQELESYFQAKSPGVFSTDYFGKKYNVLVKPVAGLPYFILIFSDTAFKETRDLEIYSFTIAMMILFFAFLFIQLMIIFIVSARQSFFKNQLFDTTWIGPKKSCQKEYSLSACLNIVLIFFLFLMFSRTTFLEYFFILLFTVSFIPLFLNYIFAKRYQDEKRNVLQFKITAIICLASIIFITDVAAFRLLDKEHTFHLLVYEFASFSAAALLYTVRASVYNFADTLKQKFSFLRRWGYISSFTFMGLTRLIITSGIPIVFFYFSSYNYEQNLNIRYRHMNFINSLAARTSASAFEESIKKNQPEKAVYADSSWIKQIDLVDKNELEQEHFHSYTKEQRNTIEYLKLFRLYLTDMSVTEDKFYTAYAGDSSFFFNHLLNDACIKESGTSTYLQSTQSGKYIRIRSANLNYKFPNMYHWNDGLFKGCLFWLLLLAVMIIFYFILYNIIKKLFALNLPDISIWKSLDDKILSDKNLNNLVFVIGLPGAGKKYYIIDKINNGEIKLKGNTTLKYVEGDDDRSNVFIADLINIPDSTDSDGDAVWQQYERMVFNSKNKLIIVNHFEYNIQDAQTNRKKLNFLERIMLEEHSNIIILSSIHPVAFLDSVLSQSTAQPGISVPGEDLERWHVLLGHYRIALLPLDFSPTALKTGAGVITVSGKVVSMKTKEPLLHAKIKINNTITKTYTNSECNFLLQTDFIPPFTIAVSAKGYITEEMVIEKNEQFVFKLEEAYYNWKDRIRTETNYTHFLKKMQQPVIDITSQLQAGEQLAKSDELAFKLQVTSHYFYMYIWQSLTKEEKFLLYDLAEDNLVNSFDNYNLSMLIGKGVIIRPDGTLKLFNRGFRNFILTAIGNTEAKKIKAQINDNGNWGKLKNPLMIVVFSILAFLLTSQEESYSRIITYVAALGAGVPGILKLFSIFEKPGDKMNG